MFVFVIINGTRTSKHVQTYG